MSISSVKKVRRSKDPGYGKQQKNSVSEAPPARSEQIAENQHWEAPVVGSPLFEKHLGSGDRRYSRYNLGISVHTGKGLGCVGKNNVDAAAKVGSAIAERAKKAGVEDVLFDRGGFLFHGKVKALAEAAREGGLKF